MKFLFSIIILFSLFSCVYSVNEYAEFCLLPQADEFHRMGSSDMLGTSLTSYHLKKDCSWNLHHNLLERWTAVDNVNNANVICNIDSTLDIPSEGYIICISLKKIEIESSNQAGLFYALCTLEQIIVDAEEQKCHLPLCQIQDAPKLSYRAVHIDLKHHMKRLNYIYKIIDRLAKLKINALIIELEDKIAYKKHNNIGAEDALSIKKWREISEYAHRRNIELSPLVQGLGHASFILKHSDYKDLRDDLSSDWAFNPLDEGTYELQFDLYDDAIEATPYGKYLHIGGDEVHTTGRNCGKSYMELQLYWLNKVSKYAVKQNRKPIFWDDMPFRLAGVYHTMFDSTLTHFQVDSIWETNESRLSHYINLFPKNCYYMRWNYSMPKTYGNVKAMEWMQQHDLKVIGATSAQVRWVLMPHKESNMYNIRAFADHSIDQGLEGLLLTLWDDDSPHFELFWRGIFAFADNVWSGRTNHSELQANYRKRAFSVFAGDTSYAFINSLEEPVAFWKDMLITNGDRNYLKKQPQPLSQHIIELPNPLNLGAWSQSNQALIVKADSLALVCKKIGRKIMHLKSLNSKSSYTLDVYEQVNNLVSFSLNAVLTLRDFDTAANQAEREQHFNRIKQLPRQFNEVRSQMEKVYSKTRYLNKPMSFILDQDHHNHLANQSINFDWQFMPEMILMHMVDEMTYTKAKK